jgi:hypothetical protein
MSFPDPARIPRLYLEPRQAQTRAPSDWENLLGDALEAAFAAGVWELEPLVGRLNEAGLRTPDGAEWTAERLAAELARLGR